MNNQALADEAAQLQHAKRKCQLSILFIILSFLIVAPISFFLGKSHWLYAPLVVFLGVFLSESTKQIKECVEHGISALSSFGSYYWLITAFFVLLIFSLGLYAILPKSYPFEDGKWANFNTGAGGGAVNAFNLGFNIFSDNTFNMDSRCNFKNMSLHDGEGHLKLQYYLVSTDYRTPYCGVFSDFSPEGTTVFDVSRFSSISFRIRSKKFELQDTVVILSLQTTDIAELGTFEYPEFIIPNDNIGSQWSTVTVDFSQLGKPDWSSSPEDITFNPRKLFRIAIVAKGRPNKETTGEIEMDDIYFR